MGASSTVSIWDALAAFGAGLTLSWLLLGWKARKYKKRWDTARKILDSHSVDEILDGDPPPPKQIPSALLKNHFVNGRWCKTDEQGLFDKMESYERADLEIARAKKGLEPLDDLKDMESYDVADVLHARMAHKSSKV